MDIIETTRAAYKGVDFLAITSTITGSQKDVLFEYPNSTRQKIENLGRRPRGYNLTIIIPHTDFANRRDNLLRVLEDGLRGPLEHPFYGRIENVVAREYTISERITALGRAEIDVNFAIDDDEGLPQRAGISVSEASSANNALQDSVHEEISTRFGVTSRFTGNFSDARELIGAETLDAFMSILSTAAASTTILNEYSALINRYSSQINQLISVPNDLADSVREIFGSGATLFSSARDTFSAFASLSFFDFGDSSNKIRQSTAGRVERVNNRDTINLAMQSSALGYAYLSAAQIDFLTVDEIEVAAEKLDAQYLKITTSSGLAISGTASPLTRSVGLSSDSLLALSDLRKSVSELFDEQRSSAKKIITVSTSTMPMAVLAYSYYGDTALTDTLLSQNDILAASFVSGEIKILTE